MPFTLAHAAAVVPVARRWPALGATALAIGAWVPDYEYFLFQTTRATQHSASGLFVFCLPLGLLTLVLWERGVGAAAVLLLPEGLRDVAWRALRRGAGLPAGWGGAAGWARAAAAIVLGALTHIVWDAATHPGGFVVEAVPALSATIAHLHDWPVRVYSLLQHGSSLLGLSVLAWVAARWVRRERVGVAQMGRGDAFVPGGPAAFVPAGVAHGPADAARGDVPDVPAVARRAALFAIGFGATLVGLLAGAWAARDLAGMNRLAIFVVRTAIAAIPAAAAGLGLWAVFARRYLPRGSASANA